MTQPPEYDINLLDSIVAEHSNAWYARGCGVGRFVQSLDNGEFRGRIVRYLADPNIGHAALATAIRETTGVSIRQDTLRRHRLQICSCSDETRS